MKWKNPFDGLDMPIPPQKPKKLHKEPKKDKEGRSSDKSASDLKRAPKTKTKMPPGTTPPVKIRLLLNGPPVVEEDTASEAGSSSQGSRNVSRRPSAVSHPHPHPHLHLHSHPLHAHTAPVLPVTIRRGSSSLRRPKTFAEPSDDSATSDSEMEIDGPIPSPLGLSRLSKSTTSTKTRKERPPPLPLSHTSRHGASHLSRSIGSPIIDWTNGAMAASPTYTATTFPAPLSSPFPSHSLDNTTWTVRHDRDRFAAIETSSSSSDDEMRDPIEWGSSSGILVQGSTEDLDNIKRIWTAEDEEAKVKEATDALRVLFPLSTTPEEDVDREPVIQYNQLDNRPRPAPSESSSLAESTSTSTATATARGGPLKSADLAASIALTGWLPNSSPAPSPTLKSLSFANVDTSPSQHLSKLSNSFEPADMDIDEEPWLDECGELPVKAEDSLSDIDLGSTVGDTPTPEQDRQYNTAAWARDAAASTSSFRVKEEPDEDYPSPLTTEPDADDASAGFRASRASSSDSHTPSSRSSELPAFDIDTERLAGFNLEEVLMGPESVSLEELDGWILPGLSCRPDKTPQRAGRAHAKMKHHRGKTEGARCSGDWGSIGVGMAAANILALHNAKSTPHRSRSTKTSRRRRSSPPPLAQLATTAEEYLSTPPQDKDEDVKPSLVRDGDTDMELDGIGPAELEAACAEAEAREEEHRKALRAQREQHKALLEAYRYEVKEEHTRRQGAISPDMEPASPWPDLNGAWGSSSTESVNLTTPTPSAIPPSFLHTLLGSPPDLGFAGGVSMGGLGVDPKVLVSPPLGAITLVSEDVLSQADIDAVMKDASAPSGVKGKDSAAAVPPASATSTSTTNTTSISSSSSAPITTKKAAAKTKSESKAAKAKEAKTASSTTANCIAPVTNGAAHSSTAVPIDKDKHTAGGTTTTTSTTAVPAAATAAKPRSFAKILCPGMNACVVDNIPVYSHASINKKTSKTVVVLRRLDTDFGKPPGPSIPLTFNPRIHYLSPSSPVARSVC